ncbi:TM1266 family iron-only hydrogenase system putative regulator, partial [Nitratidesulfovibrio termitidis]|uniref:TM1266 family iron-only hydrogenase system putative regulator n=1 Tax=Nitratidesulfovibrio termitidis TaxID=42252 RepID=UPI00054D8493
MQANGQCKRVGVEALLVSNREACADKVNAVINEFGSLVIERMGVPYLERGVGVISLIVDGTTDELGAMTGRLGAIP